MPVRLVGGLIAALVVALAAPAVAAQSVTGGSAESEAMASFRSCRILTDDSERVRCYDLAFDQHLSFDYAGQGRESTPVFDSANGFVLRYRNEDVIFVIYVYSADDNTLIKSHSSGPGEGQISIDATGRFYVEVKATGAWKIWIDPRPIDDNTQE